MPALSAKTLGVLAVVGLVLAFSLSSTLVKRAQSPGVLLAFWRMVTVSLAGERATLGHRPAGPLHDVRQALVPGVFLGAEPRDVLRRGDAEQRANAVLIGSLARFLIVPAGAGRSTSTSIASLVFSVVAFGGVALVLLSVPPNGDASLQGNVFGFLAMLLLVGYVISTTYFRHEMDVTMFMGATCPIATVAVLPLAIIDGDASD